MGKFTVKNREPGKFDLIGQLPERQSELQKVVVKPGVSYTVITRA